MSTLTPVPVPSPAGVPVDMMPALGAMVFIGCIAFALVFLWLHICLREYQWSFLSPHARRDREDTHVRALTIALEKELEMADRHGLRGSKDDSSQVNGDDRVVEIDDSSDSDAD